MKIGGREVSLDEGHHDASEGKACVMEWVSIEWMMRHGLTLEEAWAELNDHPVCTDPLIYNAAQTVNDRLADEERQRLVPLIARLSRCHTPSDAMTARRVRVRVACWAERSVLDLIDDPDRRAFVLAAIETAEAWLRGEATEHDCLIVAAAAASPAPHTASYAVVAADAAVAADLAERDLVMWLDELLDQWEKACAEEGALADEPPVPV